VMVALSAGGGSLIAAPPWSSSRRASTLSLARGLVSGVPLRASSLPRRDP
jgi:hypothetical protein